MKFNKTEIEGVWLIEMDPHEDERGYFMRAFCADEFAKQGISFPVAQANRSFTRQKGVIRGLHFQRPPKMEAKLVQCTSGSFYQVAVDLRENSPTRGRWVGEEISEANKKMILVPQGCATGIQTLSENCGLLYFMSEFYSPEHNTGVRYDDPAFSIKWPLPPSLVSEKDKAWPLIAEIGWIKA